MCVTGPGMVGKRCIGKEGDAGGSTATVVHVGRKVSGAVLDENSLTSVVVEANVEGHGDGKCTREAEWVHGDTSHTLANAVAAAAVVVVVAVVIQCSDSAWPHVVDVVLRNTHSGEAVLDIRFFPSRVFPSRTTPRGVKCARPKPTANRSLSDYETHGSDLAGPAVALDGVK